ncbi:MAG: hypothetical protein PHU03_00875 [Syntrophales bacterium]|nr:hypothetical protein [Syntrophales bacterium]
MPVKIPQTLLGNRNFIFILAIAAGLLTDYPARWTELLLLPVLGAAMTLSVLNVPNHVFRSPKVMTQPAITGIAMTYLLLAGVTLALSFLIIRDPALRAGFILIAASPPSVAVIPFNSMLRGDESFMLFASIGSYLAALLMLPLIAFLFLDIQHSKLMHFAVAAGGLVLLPILISRLLLISGWNKPLEPVRGLITDWLFFIVIYTIISLNRGLILENPTMILPVATVAFISIFVLGSLIRLTGKKLGLERKIIIPLVLIGTLKHFGLSGGIALTFFEKEAALPSAVGVVFLVLNIIWLNRRDSA